MVKNLPGAIWNPDEVVLRILYCSENYCPHDHRFLSAITENGKHEVFWFRLEGDNRIQEERDIPKSVKIVERKNSNHVGWKDYFRLKQEFSRVIMDVKPDVIHAGPIQRVAFLAVLNDFHPLICMSWGFDMLQDANRNFFWKWVTRYTLKRADWLIADCETVRESAAIFGYVSDHVTIFPWGVDQHLFSPDSRSAARQLIGFQDDLLIVHTRSWEPRYGVDILLNGLNQALKNQPNIHVLMIGGGTQAEEIKSFVAKNNMKNHIHFLGYQSNEKLVDYYRAADVYVSASHVDGSSVALLEAMACGCVPIVSDIPSNQEWVSNHINGWTFRDYSSTDLADKIQKAAQQKGKLKIYRKAALQKIKNDADWGMGIVKLMETYHNAAAL